jgi:hypothetical protein
MRNRKVPARTLSTLTRQAKRIREFQNAYVPQPVTALLYSRMGRARGSIWPKSSSSHAASVA